jgi:hypothetical protein
MERVASLAEVAFALKVIDVGGGVTPNELIARAGAGGSWHIVWAKAGGHASRAKAHPVTLRATLAVFALEGRIEERYLTN